MSAPVTPQCAPTSNSRTSQSRLSGMRDWVTNPSPATFMQTRPKGQLLPQQTLRSKLEEVTRDASTPKTLATSIKSQLDEDESPDTQSEDTLAEAEDIFIRRSKSPVDLDAPYPTPLHVIAAVVDSSAVHGTKAKLDDHIWELSDLGSTEKEDEPKTDQIKSFFPSEVPGTEIPKTIEDNALVLASSFSLANGPSIYSWVSNICGAPKVNLSPDIAENNACDINTFTGELITPIRYPETHKNLIEGEPIDEKGMAWRQANMTSELHLQREINVRQKLAEKVRAKLQEQDVQPPHQEDPWPKAKCLIRPALTKDFAQIARIINMETAKERPRVLQSEPVTPGHISYLFNHCQANYRPFIVLEAAEDEVMDRSKWPGTDEEYGDYVHFKKSQKSTLPVGVLGFAFVTESRIGFLLSIACSGSTYSGQIKLLVHPEHRQKKFGSALMDRILASTSVYHRSLIDYKWESPGIDTLIYNELAARNKRKYTRLYLEMAMGKDDAQNEWLTKWMEKFEFKQTACFEKALKTDRKRNSEWLDLVVWEFAARPENEIIE